MKKLLKVSEIADSNINGFLKLLKTLRRNQKKIVNSSGIQKPFSWGSIAVLWNSFVIALAALKGLSHQFEFRQKWYGWKEKK